MSVTVKCEWCGWVDRWETNDGSAQHSLMMHREACPVGPPKPPSAKPEPPKRNFGGPAFPVPSNHNAQGMPLWDWYAGHAIPQAIVVVDPKEAARLAAGVADAMLVERERRVKG